MTTKITKLKLSRRLLWQLVGWLAIAAVLVWCSACANLYEDTWEQRFDRPCSDVALPTNPPWDSLPEVATPETGR